MSSSWLSFRRRGLAGVVAAIASSVLLVVLVVTVWSGRLFDGHQPAAGVPPPITTDTTASLSHGASGVSAGPVFTVRSVTDGDTLTLSDGRVVRLAQVDAPETSECFGSESTVALRALAADQVVTLRRPATAPATDRYGRTLAEVYVGGVSVDEALVHDGAAEWYDQYAHEDEDLARRLEAAEQQARAARRGLWATCKAVASATPTTAPPPTAGLSAPVMGNCHPGYPDDCLPSAPPDLDCGDVGRRVRVDRRFGDLHGLDADGDGSGCESYGSP